MTMHHIVADAWSFGVLIREASVLYGAFSRGLPSPLPELALQYADYAAWQRAMAGRIRADEATGLLDHAAARSARAWICPRITPVRPL